MKKHKGLFIISGVVWTALVALVYFHEFLHSVLNIDPLPGSPRRRWAVVILAGSLITLITLWLKGYVGYSGSSRWLLTPE
jgi:hypothetical protein